MFSSTHISDLKNVPMRWNQTCPINIRVTLNIFSSLKPSCYWALAESVTVLFYKAVNLASPFWLW